MKKIALIGSTGSIGKQVLNVVSRHREEFEIVSLVTGHQSSEFSAQISEFNPKVYAVAGSRNISEVLDGADVVFNAAGGFAGLSYSLAAIERGQMLALANKETLVCGGEFVTALAKKHGAEIIPVDSEHSAIWQCLGYDVNAPFKKLIITASGGAFRGRKQSELKKVTPAEALNHPTWKMGKKITIDSATLLNKGYEVIEAHILYNAPYEKIQTVIQPQSIIHSLVEFDDGAVLAQMGLPSMEVPISLALSYPERLTTAVAPMDFTKAFSIIFEPLVRRDYPLYDIALKCGEAGGTLPCILNAADEVAVYAFLDDKITLTDIYAVVNEVLQHAEKQNITSFEQLEEADKAARISAEKIIERF